MLIYVSVLFAILGVVLYSATEGKLSEIGKVAYFCGLLAALLQLPRMIDLLH